MRQVFNWNGNFRPIGDGIWWQCVEGCDQFTLTVEQLAQKEEKRVNAVKYLTIKDYRGTLFPISIGFRTAFCVPCSEDPRMRIDKSDIILVTRWQRFNFNKDKNYLNLM